MAILGQTEDYDTILYFHQLLIFDTSALNGKSRKLSLQFPWLGGHHLLFRGAGILEWTKIFFSI